MSDFNYGRLAASAKGMIHKFGKLADLFVNVETPNVSEPWNPPTIETKTLKTKMVFLSYKVEDIDGTVIKMGDRKVLVDAMSLTLTPEVDAWVVDPDGVRYTVVNLKRIDPGNTKLLYTLQVRQ